MDKLVADEVDPELYNVEDECPNCHTEGDGFEMIGQVGKIAKEDPVVEPEEEATIENDDPVEGDVGFENDHTEEEGNRRLKMNQNKNQKQQLQMN